MPPATRRRPQTPTRGSRRCGTSASTGARSASALPTAVTVSGGSLSSTCTRSGRFSPFAAPFAPRRCSSSASGRPRSASPTSIESCGRRCTAPLPSTASPVRDAPKAARRCAWRRWIHAAPRSPSRPWRHRAGRESPRRISQPPSRRSCTVRSGKPAAPRMEARNPTSGRCCGRSKNVCRTARSTMSASDRRPTSACGGGGNRPPRRGGASFRSNSSCHRAPCADRGISGAAATTSGARSRRATTSATRRLFVAATAGRSCVRRSPGSRCCSSRGPPGRWTKRVRRSMR